MSPVKVEKCCEMYQNSKEELIVYEIWIKKAKFQKENSCKDKHKKASCTKGWIKDAKRFRMAKESEEVCVQQGL